jgi:hypothetical protein
MLESEKTSIEKLRILVLVPEEGAKKYYTLFYLYVRDRFWHVVAQKICEAKPLLNFYKERCI